MSRKPPLITDQGIRLLTETDNPLHYLRVEYFRSRRPGTPGSPVADDGAWIPVTRRDVVGNSVQFAPGRRCDFSRVALTTDAGMGKSVNMGWLHDMFNEPGRGTLAFLIELASLPQVGPDFSQKILLPLLRQAERNGERQLPEDQAIRLLDRLRRQGRLVLLFDAIDQTGGNEGAIRTLAYLLGDTHWQKCRFVISGRPHALRRHWTVLFGANGDGWRFLQLDEFTEPQQRLYLGKDDQGNDRIDRIPEEAREILSVPRVLEYLQRLSDRELTEIRTPADVYWKAINRMIQGGLLADEARLLGLPVGSPVPRSVQRQSVQQAFKLLGAMAFEMVATRVPRDLDPSSSEEPTGVPNFRGVERGQFQKFCERVYERVRKPHYEADYTHFLQDVHRLGAMNDVLQQGLFDVDSSKSEGLDQILWRNRTLQEFLAAYWLSQHCTKEERATAKLNQWVYLADDPPREEYYWVWRFATEMPADAREPESWIGATETLYGPADRRPSEMIYRSWIPMEQYAREGEAEAMRVHHSFLGEFEEILAGKHGRKARRVARTFRDSFITLPAGEFRMGSPPKKQGMSDEVQQWFTEWLERSQSNPEDAARRMSADMVFSPGKPGERERERIQQFLVAAIRDHDLGARAPNCSG